MMTPYHEHDCDRCTYVGTYPSRYVHEDYRTGECNDQADVWKSCDATFTTYIVRYGAMGEYATTNDPGQYILAPFVGEEPRF